MRRYSLSYRLSRSSTDPHPTTAKFCRNIQRSRCADSTHLTHQNARSRTKRVIYQWYSHRHRRCTNAPSRSSKSLGITSDFRAQWLRGKLASRHPNYWTTPRRTNCIKHRTGNRKYPGHKIAICRVRTFISRLLMGSIISLSPILAICHNADQVRSQVCLTLLHEIGHYYAIIVEQLHELGWALSFTVDMERPDKILQREKPT